MTFVHAWAAVVLLVAGGIAEPPKPGPSPSPSPNPTPTPVPAPHYGPFDRGAAAAALGGVNVQSCKAATGGNASSGHLKLTFEPGGPKVHPKTVVVDAGPYITLGTAGNTCLVNLYSAILVPGFSGEAVTIGKSYAIQ